jgi:hypothetical protein
LYNHFLRFPREEKAWRELRAQRRDVAEPTAWKEFRGVIHSHSELSHDCEVPFEEILRVLRAVGADFICLSDHPDRGRADFDRQWRGLREGKLFIPGYEMKEGFMPFGVKAGVVLSNQMESAALARGIVENGGLLFYAHPEEPRDWVRPELTGMEIYNIHIDFKRFKGGWRAFLPDVLVNLGRYPDHLYYLAFRRPEEFLRRFDELAANRHLTAIAANDCHQNVGIRAIYLEGGTVRLEDTSPKVLREFRLNWFTRPLARLLFGPLEPNRKLFHLQLDPYARSARFVNTHVLASELSESAVLEALGAGRAFVGFDLMADSSGFQWFARVKERRVAMGEAAELGEDTLLCARSPLPCRFAVWRDGKVIYQAEGREIAWKPAGRGKYRVEAELKVVDRWVPWVYANPIELR